MNNQDMIRLLKALGERERRLSVPDEARTSSNTRTFRTPDCVPASRMKAICVQFSLATSREKEHIQSCTYCHGLFCGMTKWLNDPEIKSQQEELQKIRPVYFSPLRKLFDFKANHTSKRRSWVVVSSFVALFVFVFAYSRRGPVNDSIAFPTDGDLRKFAFLDETLGGSETKAPITLTPVETAVLSSRPTFRWTKAGNARDYEILIWREPKSAGKKTSAPIQVRGLSWHPPQDLPAGLYRWKVNVQGNVSEFPGALFEIIGLKPEERADLEKSANALRSSRDDESLAALYLRYGLFTEAHEPLLRLYKKKHEARIKKLLDMSSRASGILSHE